MIWIVAHDAGGAEIVSAWVKLQGLIKDCRFILSGPAVKIFQRKLGAIPIESLEILETAKKDSDEIFLGTGSDFERSALLIAKKIGLRSVAFLDHWVNQRNRFTIDSTFVAPNEIWVGDQHAFDLASKLIPECEIKLIENPYFIELRAEIASFHEISRASPRSKFRVLFICEAFLEHARRNGIEVEVENSLEYQGIRRFFRWIEDNSLSDQIEAIRFRLHPSEAPGKYDSLLQEIEQKGFRMDCPGSALSLAEEVSWADWVVGITSAALIGGILGNKKVFSCLPPDNELSPLPFPEIRRI